ncbi:glycosyltransferase family 4 protein [Peribacillus simplex]|uniref:glycosyltransferase family 4 protein n=1 Tax=Peribacillus simplex TaxID=1478 RepID=UPI003D2D6CF3
MSIAMIIPSLETGGAESMAYQLAKKLDKNKFNLHFICLSSRKETFFEKELYKSGVNITYMDKGLGVDIKVFFQIWKILNQKKIGLVHTHLGACLYVFPWIFSHKIKLIHTIHSTPLKELPYLHRFILKILYKIRKAVPIAISDNIKKQTSVLYGLKNETIPVIYNPVQIDQFNSESSNKDYKTLTFVCVARLTKPKNHSMLLRAFSKVNQKYQNTKLLIVGDGELREELEKETNFLKLTNCVKFLGKVDNIPYILSESDVFVLSSYYEGLPMTILEAMAAKLPIIATNVGGVPDIVKENGILVRSEDVECFANAMAKLCDDKLLRHKMGKISYEIVKGYDLNIITKQYEKIYEKYS